MSSKWRHGNKEHFFTEQLLLGASEFIIAVYYHLTEQKNRLKWICGHWIQWH